VNGAPPSTAERRRPGWQVLLFLVVAVGGIGATIWFGVR
jgi:cytochrome c1